VEGAAIVTVDDRRQLVGSADAQLPHLHVVPLRVVAVTSLGYEVTSLGYEASAADVR
jgi:hypothetical protein